MFNLDKIDGCVALIVFPDKDTKFSKMQFCPKAPHKDFKIEHIPRQIIVFGQ